MRICKALKGDDDVCLKKIFLDDQYLNLNASVKSFWRDFKQY